MMALSVRQPYAGLIVGGVKTVECRSWRTPHRVGSQEDAEGEK